MKLGLKLFIEIREHWKI